MTKAVPDLSLFRAFLLLLLAFPASPAFALQLEARLDSQAVHLGDPVHLVLETDAEPGDALDLGTLGQDFRVVGRRSSRNLSIVNGQRTERYQLVLTLVPRRAGLLEIPPIRVGEAATAPIQLAVGDGPAEHGDPAPPDLAPQPANDSAPAYVVPSEGSAGPETAGEPDTEAPVLVEASIRPSEVRLGQEAVLVVRVLMPYPVNGPGLQDLSVAGARLLPLGEDWDQERRGEQRYHVYERHYSLFPEKAGRLHIDPVVFKGWRTGPATSGYQPQSVQADSDPINLEVLPADPEASGTGWLPARDIRLTETGPESYQIRVGQSLERVISIRAEGIASGDLPALRISTPHELDTTYGSAGLWDERTPSGVIGTRRESIRLSAGEPGRFLMPAVTLDWWDTDTDERKTAKLPARELIVLEAAETPASPALFEPSGVQDTWTEPASPEPEDTPPPSVPLAAQDREAGGEPSKLWVWASAALGIAWLFTLVAWLANRRSRVTPDASDTGADEGHTKVSTTPAKPGDPVSRAIDEVRRAYESEEAGIARESLLAWAALALPDQPPGNLALLAKRCREPLRGEILLLEQAFFSPRPVQWERRRVWERLPGFEPLPLQEPASFRRKRPIRRKKTAADSPS